MTAPSCELVICKPKFCQMCQIFQTCCLFLFVATILSQSSSSTGVPVKTLARGSSVDTAGGSPLLNRQRSSKRIIAREGSRILEKFNRVQSVQEDDITALGIKTCHPNWHVHIICIIKAVLVSSTKACSVPSPGVSFKKPT